MPENQEVENWVCPRLLFNSGKLVEGAAIGVSRNRIQAVTQAQALPSNVETQVFDGILSPGFVDLQVNGGGGVFLNETPTRNAIWEIARAHRSFGTTAILPTVITDADDVLSSAVDAAIEAYGTNGIIGLHIEGPHISIDRRGTHKAEYVRPINDTTINQIAMLRRAGLPVMITLAPDVVGTDSIKRIVDLGAVVSIGHSKATSAVVDDALAAGARCFTHLFNAMSPMTGREPGVVGAAINSEAFAGIICDGIHVADDMVGLAIRARPVADRMFLVSDAMPTVGGPPEFELYGKTVHLEDNRLVNDEGSLAGAHTTQADGVRRLVEKVGLPLGEALRMAVTVPGEVIGQKMDLVDRRSADEIICLGNDLTFSGFLPDLLAPQNA